MSEEYDTESSGLNKIFFDIKELNQSHHYAGLFFLAYYTYSMKGASSLAPAMYNTIKDWNNPGDIDLGNSAAVDAYSFWNGSVSMRGIADLIMGYK